MKKARRQYYLAIMAYYSTYGWEEVSAYELNERKNALADIKEYRFAEPKTPFKIARRWENVQEESNV